MENRSLLILLTISVMIIAFTHKLLRRLITRTPNKNLPPSPPSLPVIGHLHQLKKPAHRTLLALARTYGPVFSLRFGTCPVVVVSSASIAEECLTQNDVVLANRPETLVYKHLGYNHTTVMAAPYSDHWRNLRRICTVEIFSSHRLNVSLGIRKDEVNRLLRKLHICGRGGGFARVEPSDALTELMFNVVMRMMAGKRYYGEDVSDVEEASKFRDIIREIVTFLGTSYAGDYLPLLKWVDYDGYMKKMFELGKKIDGFLQGLVDEHRKKKKVSEEEKNMIDYFLVKQASQPEYYTDEIIKGFLLRIQPIAGTDASTITIEWALANLLNHPNMLEKAKTEIDTRCQDRPVDESDLLELPYIQNIISETLRLHPPAPLLIPHYSSDECIVGGYDVPRGTTVLINAWAIHRDPEQWPDPMAFKPERFESGEGQMNGLMLPFGMGRRACPGAPLAHKLLGLTLASLIQCFEWKRIGEEEVDMSEGEGLTMPKEKPLEALCKAREMMIKVLS
ncbi:isoflavone 3'-hydroxylase-like [Rhodamnia argentea]|uniref:Isoflavone 3'-hydroxylase-like n=1 Tax=Rhodamnia argentea TaxID=178133 RepID=A0ABM3HRG0_9MYRT|nr:isoflavone 3'-hydroxylase-like [Rhodamnia argentea]